MSSEADALANEASPGKNSESAREASVASDTLVPDPVTNVALRASEDAYWGQPHWLHPISLFFEFASNIRSQILPAIIALFTATQWGMVGLGIALMVFAISMGVAIFRYVTLRYQLKEDDLIIDQGWIFRQHRTIPLARIQNIDLVQNLMHRLFRVAEVRIETASGNDAEAKLRVLSLAEVVRLRARIFRERSNSFAHASESGVVVEGMPQDIAQPTIAQMGSPETVLAIPTKDLILAGIISDRGWVMIAVVTGLMWQLEPWEHRKIGNQVQVWWNWAFGGLANQGWRALLVLLPLAFAAFLLLKIFSAVWHILRFHGYRLQRVGDDLRIECGLFTKLSATIPRPRIQFISIHRSWLARRLGLAAIRIETASSSGEGDNATVSISRRWFVPVIRETAIAEVMKQLRPGLIWDESQIAWSPLSPKAGKRMLRLGLMISACVLVCLIWFQWIAAIASAVLLLLASIWYAKKKSRSMAYARTDWGVIYRSGLLGKICSMTFMDKIQTVVVRHSPFDRRWGYGDARGGHGGCRASRAHDRHSDVGCLVRFCRMQRDRQGG